MIQIKTDKGLFFANTLRNWLQFSDHHIFPKWYEITHLAQLPDQAEKIHRGVWKSA